MPKTYFNRTDSWIFDDKPYRVQLYRKTMSGKLPTKGVQKNLPADYSYEK